MKTVVGLGAVMAVALFAGAAQGQQSWKVNCVNNGANMPEPLSEAQSISVVAATCTVETGPMAGAVATQNAIWARDGGPGTTLLSGDGVVRKPGSVAAYRLTSGTLTPVIQDGKQTGWIATGKAVYTWGFGDGAALKGKAFSWKSAMTGPRRYATDNTLD